MFEDFFPKADLKNLRETLNEHGVAVLTDVFTEKECDLFRNKMYEYLKQEFKINEPDDYEKLNPKNGGILRYFGLPLLNQVLDLKTDQRTIEPFKEIWQEDKLTTSFDAIFIGPPPELTKKNFNSFFQKTKLHLDQSSDKKHMACVQAFINLENTQHGDGCLSVLEKSHLYFNEFIETFKIETNGIDWYLLKQDIHVEWFKNKGCNLRSIIAPKGSMVFWDSRTVHTGTLPREGRPSPNWRFLIYVCYTPQSRQTMKDSNLKRNAYINNWSTSHWPYSFRVFKIDNYSKKNSLRNLTTRHKLYLGL